MDELSKFPLRGLVGLFVNQTHSTNALLWEMIRKELLPEGFVVYTDFQTAGKGQPGNVWESETAQNLLFSLILYPNHIPMDQLFLISQIVSLGIKQALCEIVDNISIKWPNDIYWNNKKIAGILIENSLQGKKIKTVVGIGLNVNQKNFTSDAPNPVSLFQITGKSVDRKQLLERICENILNIYHNPDFEKIQSEYAENIYRKVGFFNYSTYNEAFRARIVCVYPDGQLLLETETGERKAFYFKEVEFC